MPCRDFPSYFMFGGHCTPILFSAAFAEMIASGAAYLYAASGSCEGGFAKVSSLCCVGDGIVFSAGSREGRRPHAGAVINRAFPRTTRVRDLRKPSLAPASRAATVFEDITAASGVKFDYVASHTSRKYLIETMGSGAALFDYDNDGRLDIFLVNGAQLSDPTAKGTIPQKRSPKEWNRLFHQRPDGTSRTSPKRPACRAQVTGWASPWVITTMTVTRTCT